MMTSRFDVNVECDYWDSYYVTSELIWTAMSNRFVDKAVALGDSFRLVVRGDHHG